MYVRINHPVLREYKPIEIIAVECTHCNWILLFKHCEDIIDTTLLVSVKYFIVLMADLCLISPMIVTVMGISTTDRNPEPGDNPIIFSKDLLVV